MTPDLANASPFSRYILPRGLMLDARRALWIEETATLVVADVHLGYAWAHRHNGQLLPISAGEDTLPRLEALLDDYAARELVLLGDIVHRAVSVAPLRDSLCALFSRLAARVTVRLVPGNHDRHLSRLLAECEIRLPLEQSVHAGAHLLVHGDRCAPENGAQMESLIIGHEHPAISLSDGAGSTVKCPCFLVGEKIVILPAFSRWAAGSDFRSHPPMSPCAAGAEFRLAVAIMGKRLLPLPLEPR